MNALDIQRLGKIYDNGKIALQNVSLSVPEGSFFALLGPNGAGKSTLINILADTVRPSSGEITLFGKDMFTERSWCKRRMGVVPQEIAFDPFFSPREILRFSRGMYGQRADDTWVDELLERLELTKHAQKNTRQLSGGMRRRLLVAQALVHRPKLVVLDEPTAGVDVELRKRLWDFMRELNAAGTTILLTTHYLEEAEELCDQVAIIDKGELLTARSMDDLLSEVASSTLWMRYDQAPYLSAEHERLLADYSPRICDSDIYLTLSRHGNTSNFNAAYQAAAACLGGPLDAGVRQEDLEDVFLRLTHKEKS